MKAQKNSGNFFKEVDYGFVVEDKPEGFAQVRLPRREVCRTNMRVKNICDQFDEDSMILRAQNPVKAIKGNKVEVRFTNPDLGKSVFIVYLFPILSMIIGAVLGNILNPLGDQNLSAVLGAVLLLVICLALNFGINRSKWQQTGPNAPRITNILE
jgi:sigma-E factor negative regulatory protein RseC